MTATTIVHLPSLAEQINAEHDACQTSYRSSLAHAFEAGRMLLEAKGQLEHGQWGAWLASNIACSDRTARLYMQLAEAPELEERQSVADLGVAAAMKHVAKPATKPRVDVASALQGLAGGGDRLAARERVAPEAATWTSQQERKGRRALDLLVDAQRQLDAAGQSGLSAFAVGELLKDSAVQARHATAALEDLAFSFER